MASVSDRGLKAEEEGVPLLNDEHEHKPQPEIEETADKQRPPAIEKSNFIFDTIATVGISDDHLNDSISKHDQNTIFNDVLQVESRLAKKMLMCNIGPKIGALDGLVVASPNKGEKPYLPNYYFTWTRDSALVHSSLLPSFLPESYHKSYEWAGPSSASSDFQSYEMLESDIKLHEGLIRAYIQSQIKIQITINPSGGLYDGGLNEPKFEVVGSPFTGDWGRPQRDGPALRALTLIPYTHFLLDRGFRADFSYIEDNLYDPNELKVPGRIIKNDLEEVSHSWHEPSFDLWEEVNGHHFFTLIVSMRSLQAGAALAYRLNDTGAQTFYSEQAELIGKKLEEFWDNDKDYYLSTVPNLRRRKAGTSLLPDRQWWDCSLPLSLIHAGDHLSPNTYRYPNLSVLKFGATDPELQSTLYQYINSFSGLYKINAGHRWTDGWALGRYREDVYDGVGKSIANPWHICTNAVAESFYLMEKEHFIQGYLETTNITRAFWSAVFGETIKQGSRYNIGEVKFDEGLKALRRIGDAFLNVSRSAIMESDGRMSEQIDKKNGTPRGARDLTWSYASLMTAIKARQESSKMVHETHQSSETVLAN
ncbi:uncharacterized protein L201_007669 [Kwoniella dendrophila CBS 6074]|uniref:glucan 1,4-alpha-glucosidase n=1 Tax=Kwoniella dendrophila CBS 6074 TaxID=1295534 RepID=A0AAX4K556_9TREE